MGYNPLVLETQRYNQEGETMAVLIPALGSCAGV